jgi:hypothetical protein
MDLLDHQLIQRVRFPASRIESSSGHATLGRSGGVMKRYAGISMGLPSKTSTKPER